MLVNFIAQFKISTLSIFSDRYIKYSRSNNNPMHCVSQLKHSEKKTNGSRSKPYLS